LAKYKIKTHSGSKRRFYVSGTGKLLMRKCHINHMRRKKRGGTLRLFHGKLAVSSHNVKRLRRLMPYAGR
jgi:large subunit ribosomal protein L35